MPDGATLFSAAIAPAAGLNDEQNAARRAILGARAPGEKFLLTGSAGTGKTFLVAGLVREWVEQGLRVAVTAPTHKAVGVLQKKVGPIEQPEAKPGQTPPEPRVAFRTIHSALGLRPQPDGERQVFVRDKKAKPVEADVVIIDEASMLGAEMMQHIRRHLKFCFVLFCGDPAQLPPVGESESDAFQTKARFNLETIVRQAEGNPIIAAAQVIRRCQGGAMDWSWAKATRAGKTGVFVPRRDDLDDWLKRAFTSAGFEADPDQFRYLCWTNARVASVNAKVQRWRYGDLDTPFAVGEPVLFRAALLRDDAILFNTNDETRVRAITRDVFRFPLKEHDEAPAWVAEVPSWRVTVDLADGLPTEVHMPASAAAFRAVTERIVDEAKAARKRWADLHEFKAAMADLQCVYALTIHKSQGSTYRFAFVDIPDIRPRFRDAPREAAQLLYVGATRPTDGLVLVGI